MGGMFLAGLSNALLVFGEHFGSFSIVKGRFSYPVPNEIAWHLGIP